MTAAKHIILIFPTTDASPEGKFDMSDIAEELQWFAFCLQGGWWWLAKVRPLEQFGEK